MAQLVVRNLSEAVKQGLRKQAKRNGRSMEEEARQILREGIRPPREPFGWATQFQRRFAGPPLTAEESVAFDTAAEIMRGSTVRPADFE